MLRQKSRQKSSRIPEGPKIHEPQVRPARKQGGTKKKNSFVAKLKKAIQRDLPPLPPDDRSLEIDTNVDIEEDVHDSPDQYDEPMDSITESCFVCLERIGLTIEDIKLTSLAKLGTEKFVVYDCFEEEFLDSEEEAELVEYARYRQKQLQVQAKRKLRENDLHRVHRGLAQKEEEKQFHRSTKGNNVHIRGLTQKEVEKAKEFVKTTQKCTTEQLRNFLGKPKKRGLTPQSECRAPSCPIAQYFRKADDKREVWCASVAAFWGALGGEGIRQHFEACHKNEAVFKRKMVKGERLTSLVFIKK